jgi:hypothetical protein
MKSAFVLSLCFLFIQIKSVQTQPNAVGNYPQNQKKMYLTSIQFNKIKLKNSQSKQQLPSNQQHNTKAVTLGVNPFASVYQKNNQTMRKQQQLQNLSRLTQIPRYAKNQSQTKRIGGTQSRSQLPTNYFQMTPRSQQQNKLTSKPLQRQANQAQIRQISNKSQINSWRNQIPQVSKSQQLNIRPNLTNNNIFQKPLTNISSTNFQSQKNPRALNYQQYKAQSQNYPPGPHPFKVTPVYS